MGQRFRIGDTFKCPEPTSEDVRLRVRGIQMEDHWDSPQYALQLYSVLHYIADDPDKSPWGWHDSRHDYHLDRDQIQRAGYLLVSRGPEPAPVQLDLFAN